MSTHEVPCICAFHTPQNPNSAFITAPDMSVSITDDEAMRALELFHHFEWDVVDSDLPPGATDTSGVPLNRHNRNIRLAALAECVTFVRSAPGGAGIDLMSNPYYEQYINVLLDAYDSTHKVPA